MRRFALISSFVIVLIAALFSAACSGKTDSGSVKNEEQDGAPRLTSNVSMADPQAAGQLLSGFYAIENNAWRWTAGKFSAILKTPLGAAQSGGTLSFTFTIPDNSIQKLGPMALSASINGTALKSETYRAGGKFVFSADVPASLLAGESVKVDFALDKTLQPDGDKRQLGVVAGALAIAPK